MNDHLVNEIINLIQKKYGSTDSPFFSFVQDMLSNQPYKFIIQEIKRIILVTEDTDPNDDVSFGYIIQNDKEYWSLRISMVGPYAVLMRIKANGNCEALSPTVKNLSELERQIMKVISDNGITVLDQEILSIPVRLKLFNTEESNTRIYQALFTDTDILPWCKENSDLE
jgi:hypothetical protein